MPSAQATPEEHTAPDSVCLLRLSALGDISHVLPVVRTLQQHWPQTKLTWIIGKTEYQLVKDITGIEFIIFDKSQGFSAYLNLRNQLRNKTFAVLLHMQLSLRASVASLFIPAKIKLGFDRARAKDMQAFFCNAHINPTSTRQHVVDSFLEFPRHFGLTPVLEWGLPVAADAIESIRKKLPEEKQLLVINPCAIAKARNWRNWTAAGYAAVADYAQQQHGMQVVLSGGPGAIEKETAKEILARCHTSPLNLVGQTTLAELVALLKLADVVIAPDTGPVHIASALGTRTLGLYATTNPQRAGPYNFLDYVVNRYPQALAQYYQLDVNTAPWGKRVKTAEAMSLISVEAVIEKLEQLLALTASD
ncbi:MAG TPA: lipopolysaccharide heptosyltransferase family protein [Thiotrichales bacterium]|nr:lipopolysaccharide heptosyltransferase family protein [Thiotrichales bacterium]